VTDPWGSWLVKDGPLNGYKRRALREGELWWSCLDLERVLRDFVAALERVSELERMNAELLHRLHGAHAERDSAEQGDQNATAIARQWRERAGRLEGPARAVVDSVPFMDNFENWNGVPTPLLKALRAALADAQAPEREGDGAALIAAERRRQVTEEGWTPEHDDGHDSGELARAAASYALVGDYWARDERAIDLWPWSLLIWKPSDDPIRNLVRAGALIAAEIDRLRRAAPAPGEKP
jgi:hypothetical protein